MTSLRGRWYLRGADLEAVRASKKPMSPYQQARIITRLSLITVGFIALSRGMANLPVVSEPLPRGVQVLTIVVPVLFWCICWFAAGVMSLLASVRVRPLGVVGALAMSIVWSVGYLSSWCVSVYAWLRDTTLYLDMRDLSSSILFLGLAVLMFSGARLALNTLGYAKPSTR